jgi:hypothetical protein
MPLTKAEKVEAAASIMEMLHAGESHDKIMSTLGMPAEMFEEVRTFMLDKLGNELKGRTKEQHYAQYVIDQTATMRQVDTCVTELSGGGIGAKKHYNAFVGALRLKSDLRDRILDRGFDLGIIEKTADKTVVVGGIALASMSKDDLMGAIQRLIGDTTRIMSGGDVDFMELDPGPTHRGPSVIDAMVEDDEEESMAPAKPPPAAAKPAPVPKLPPPAERVKVVPPGAVPVGAPKPAFKAPFRPSAVKR